LGELHGIAGALQFELPLFGQCQPLLFQHIQRREDGFQACWLDGLEDEITDRLVEIAQRKRLALGLVIGNLLTATLVHMMVTAIAGRHPPPTAPTDDDPHK